MQIFDKIKIEIDNNGQVRCPAGETMHTYNFKSQVGDNVIYINRLKINIYLFLLRRTRKYRIDKIKQFNGKPRSFAFINIGMFYRITNS